MDGWCELVVEVERERADALAALLEAAGASAVTLCGAGDPGSGEVLEPPPGEAPLWPHLRVRALFPAGADLAPVEAAVARALGPRAGARTQRVAVADRDWVAEGQRGFAARRFGRRLWVVPSWDEPPADAAAVVRLDPGLAFGTGGHPSTALCLEWLDEQVRPGCSVIDYGCGSGVLALAALALGAGRVLAVDHDPQALEATRRNARANALDDRLEAVPPERAAGAAERLVANILAGPLIELAPALASLVVAGGRAALAGVLREQAGPVAEAYRPWFAVSAVARSGDWARIDLERGPVPGARPAGPPGGDLVQ